jgi:alkylhydroperoxidase family enzyme
MTRIAPASQPYEPTIAAELQRIMPPGIEPLLLFRTLARSPRVFAKIFAGGFLDKSPFSLREILIDRTTARLGCEYEWGVHAALFGKRVDFGETELAALVHGSADAPCWAPDEQALIALVDGLVDHHMIRPQTWQAASQHFDEAQLLEAIAITGFYHMISFLCRGLELPLETYGARFPEAHPLRL